MNNINGTLHTITKRGYTAQTVKGSLILWKGNVGWVEASTLGLQPGFFPDVLDVIGNKRIVRFTRRIISGYGDAKYSSTDNVFDLTVCND